MFEVYKPSGAFSPLFIPILLVVTGLGIGAAFVYQLLLEWIPFVFVSFILTIVFGAVLGSLGRLVVKAGRVRNLLIALIVGLSIGASSYAAKFWFQYERILWETAEFESNQRNMPVEEAHRLLKESVSFWDHIEGRVEAGWRLGGGAPVSGFFVYLIWLVEAAMVIGLATTLPRAAAREPYSEKIGQWASEEKAIMFLPIDNPEMVQQISQATSVDELLTIPIPKSDETNQFAAYIVNSILGHEMEDAYLTVKLTTISYDKDGNEQKKEEPLVRYAILTSDQLTQLNENAELLNEAIAAYQQAKYAEEQQALSSNSEDNGSAESQDSEDI